MIGPCPCSGHTMVTSHGGSVPSNGRIDTPEGHPFTEEDGTSATPIPAATSASVLCSVLAS